MDKNLGLNAARYAQLAGFSSDWRDTWWNQDYLAFLATRWGLADVREALDVGSGAGHWGQRIATLLPPDAHITGVDHEPGFLAAARDRAASRGLPHRFTYTEGKAEALPFPDDHFDLVTCQTVLIHVPDAHKALTEMTRVTKPGGLILVTEPSNLINAFIYRQTLPARADADLLRLMALDTTCVRGKRALGQGDHTIGEHLLPLLTSLGLTAVEVRQNDQCATLLPPYDSPAEALTLQHLAANQYATTMRWGGYDTTRALFSAGGGDLSTFDDLWELDLAWQAQSRDDILQHRHSFGGGLLMYIAWGRKP
jgi:SAM-dependent methyltransferase